MTKFHELSKLRALKGKAEEKKMLLKDYAQLESMSWSLVLLASGSNSTYNGLYPEGIAKARDNHMVSLANVESMIRKVCK